MKKHLSFNSHLQRCLPVLLLLSAILFVFRADAQNNGNNKPIYVAFTYLKTSPGKYNDYLSLLHNYSKKAQDHRIQQGEQLGWYIYEVLMPSGTEADYNFVGVNVSTDIQQLMDPALNMQEAMQKAFPQMGAQLLDSVMQQFSAARSMVKREIYIHQSGTTETGPPAKYAEVDFMTPVQGKEAAYAKMETGTFLAVHKQRMALGALKGWRFAQKVMPADSNDPYPYITVNFYDNFDGIMDGKYEQAVKKAYPTQNADKLFQQVNLVKKGQKNELWKLVEYTEQGMNK